MKKGTVLLFVKKRLKINIKILKEQPSKSLTFSWSMEIFLENAFVVVCTTSTSISPLAP